MHIPLHTGAHRATVAATGMMHRALRCPSPHAVAAVAAALCPLAAGLACTSAPPPTTTPPPVVNTPPPPATDNTPPAAIEVVPSGPIVVRDLKGQRAWSGSAATVHWQGDKGVLELTGVRCVFFENDREVLDATAPRAQVDEKRRLVTLSGGVRAGSRLEEAQIQADTLVWDIKTRRLTATGHITLTRGAMRMTGGDRMEADARLKDVRLSGALRFEGTVQR